MLRYRVAIKKWSPVYRSAVIDASSHRLIKRVLARFHYNGDENAGKVINQALNYRRNERAREIETCLTVLRKGKPFPLYAWRSRMRHNGSRAFVHR